MFKVVVKSRAKSSKMFSIILSDYLQEINLYIFVFNNCSRGQRVHHVFMENSSTFTRQQACFSSRKEKKNVSWKIPPLFGRNYAWDFRVVNSFSTPLNNAIKITILTIYKAIKAINSKGRGGEKSKNSENSSKFENHLKYSSRF